VESEAVDSKKKKPTTPNFRAKNVYFLFPKKIPSKKDSMKRVAERIENAD